MLEKLLLLLDAERAHLVGKWVMGRGFGGGAVVKIAVLEIANISNQLVAFGYSRIDVRLSASSVNPMESGVGR